MCFLGYLTTQKGYKVYHPLTRKYLVSKDVVFDESTFYYQTSAKKDSRDLSYLKIPDHTPTPTVDSQDDPAIIPIPALELQEANPSVSPSNTTLNGGEIGIENPTEIATFPKYYERRRKEKLPENEEGQGTQIESIESDGGGADWPIALRKEKRSCVKDRPYNLANYLNFQNVSPRYKAFILNI